MIDIFDNSQVTLLAYNFLYGQVSNGGFIQLIQNGYAESVFNSPFAEIIKTWGAIKTGEIVEKANVIYNEHKDELDKETSLEEFSELYSQITDFEPLEDEYFKIMDDETEIIKKYVEENTNEFKIDE
ncbi:MAG: DMP19 family protein [Deltaproteobacteria bacterium]|jgi:hypothetical protein|nr:DMP19 family protein [Deltaproteobacteria bacterium]